ncbi:s68305 gag polyprotein [Lasius niger]|uniref:S68305 gag polyprotein n=1 Tax=Lasius niger TaxID=67767 RepID=A0A0J7NHI7_LASNI|nr:s68305 gag polyprotein [Lasius niger]
MSSEGSQTISETEREARAFEKSDKIKSTPTKTRIDNESTSIADTEVSRERSSVMSDSVADRREFTRYTGTIKKDGRARQTLGMRLRNNKIIQIPKGKSNEDDEAEMNAKRFVGRVGSSRRNLAWTVKAKSAWETSEGIETVRKVEKDKRDPARKLDFEAEGETDPEESDARSSEEESISEMKIGKLEQSMNEIRDIVERLKMNREDGEKRTIDPRRNGDTEVAGTSAKHAGNEMKLPQGGWIVSPFEDVKFSGKRDAMNPMRFVRKFERIAQYEIIDDAEQLYFFGKCLKDQAAIWFELQEVDTIKDAKEKFVRYFWGEEQQAKFREKIYTGRYKQTKDSRMADYALDLARQAKMLEPPMGDKEFIRAIKRHFEKETTREIRTTTATSVAELISLLDEIQDEKDNAIKTRAEEKTSTAKTGYFNKKSDQPRYPTRGQRYQPNRYGRYGGGNPNKMKALPWYNNANKSNDGIKKTGFGTKTKTGEKTKTEENGEETAREKKNVNKNRPNRQKAVGALRRKTSESEAEESRRDRNEEEDNSVETNDEEIGEYKDDSENEEHDTKQLAIVRTRKIIKDLEEIEAKQESGIKGRPIVIARVGENRIITLIDSGPDFSVMSKETFER